MKKFVLLVKYGYGEAAMLTDTPDLTKAIQQFIERRQKEMPEDKSFGMPPITKAEIMPLMYESIYEEQK